MLTAELWSNSLANELLDELNIPYEEWESGNSYEYRVEVDELTKEQLQLLKDNFFSQDKVFVVDYIIFY
jgi:hypothetical protein